jgi:hypothetical protein
LNSSGEADFLSVSETAGAVLFERSGFETPYGFTESLVFYASVYVQNISLSPRVFLLSVFRQSLR